jgi:hypothetical protein
VINAKLAAGAAALLWLLWPKKAKAAPTGNVEIGEDVSITFVPSEDGASWNDYYKTKDGPP